MINDKEENESKYKVEYLGENHSKELLSYKVIILGLYGVGKTSIINKLMKKVADKEYSPTISVDIKYFQVKVNDKIIQIQLWDCCGNDEFALSTPNLFKNTTIAILVYAINHEKSFKNLDQWKNMLLNNSYDHEIFLIGNKADLKEERKIETQQGENYKKSYDYIIKTFFETSAKNGDNIDKLLENIAITIYEKNEKVEKLLENAIKGNGNKPQILDKEIHKKNKKKKKWC